MGAIHQPFKMSPSDSNQQFHLFPELPGELRELIWKFSLYGRTVLVQLKLGTWNIPTLSLEHVRGLCTFSYKENHTPPALGVCKESRDIAASFYKCSPLRAFRDRIHSPNLSTVCYCPFHDNIQIQGGAALYEYAKIAGLRLPDMRTFVIYISASAASDSPGSPTTVSWSREQSIDRETGTNEKTLQPPGRRIVHRVRRSRPTISFCTSRKQSLAGSVSCKHRHLLETLPQ